MELGTIKQKVFLSLGWLSVIIGLSGLALLNIFLLLNYELPIINNIFSWNMLAIVFGFLAFFQRDSRPLGFWGFGLGIFIYFFAMVMFFLGWMVNPFP